MNNTNFNFWEKFIYYMNCCNDRIYDDIEDYSEHFEINQNKLHNFSPNNYYPVDTNLTIMETNIYSPTKNIENNNLVENKLTLFDNLVENNLVEKNNLTLKLIEKDIDVQSDPGIDTIPYTFDNRDTRSDSDIEYSSMDNEINTMNNNIKQTINNEHNDIKKIINDIITEMDICSDNSTPINEYDNIDSDESLE